MSIFFIAMIFALGPFIELGGMKIKAPMYFVYEYVPVLNLVRIPLRAMFIGLLALAILAAFGFERIRNIPGIGSKAFMLIPIFLLENVPFPFHTYAVNKFTEPPALYEDFFAERPESVLLNLPTSVIDKRYSDDIATPAREYVYMYWQTRYKNYVVNGTSYDPVHGIVHHNLLQHARDEAGMRLLTDSLQIDFIAFHKTLMAPWEDSILLSQMRQMNVLDHVTEDGEVAIFAVRKEIH